MTGVQTWLCQAVKRSSASRVRRDCSLIAALSRLSAATMSRSYTSAAPVLRRPLLLERLEALAEVLAARRQLHGERLVAKLVVERGGRAGVEEPLGQTQRDGRALREGGGELARDRVDLPRRYRPVDHLPIGGLRTVHDAPEQDHLPGPHLA